jgi:hypothetical protein
VPRLGGVGVLPCLGRRKTCGGLLEGDGTGGDGTAGGTGGSPFLSTSHGLAQTSAGSGGGRLTALSGIA